MPEGDTVYATARRLHGALAGAEVTRSDLRVPTLALVDFTGAAVLEVAPRGKHLLMRFSDGRTLHSHLRMDGSWRVRETGTRPAGRDFEIRALIGNARWLAAGFRVHDLAVVPTDREDDLIGHLGPDLLDPDFDLDDALARWAAQPPEREIADVLLDQRVTAGIGNVYKSELLFLHRIHPQAPVATVPDPTALLADARRLLKGNVGDFNRSTTGWRQPGQQYWVYGRAGKACRRCRSRIERIMQGDPVEERVTYFCTGCQPSIRPGPAG